MIFDEHNKKIAQILEEAIRDNNSESELEQLGKDLVEISRKKLKRNDLAFVEKRKAIRHRNSGFIKKSNVNNQTYMLYLPSFTDDGCQEVEIWKKKQYFNTKLLKPIQIVAKEFSEDFRKEIVSDLLFKNAERWKVQNYDRLYINEDCLSELAFVFGDAVSLTIDGINIAPALWDMMVDLNSYLDLRTMEVRSDYLSDFNSSEERALKKKALNMVQYLINQEINMLRW